MIKNVLSLVGFVSILLVTFFAGQKHAQTYTRTEATTVDHLPQQVYAVKPIPSANWAGELVPTNMDTRERLDREILVNSYWHSSTLLNIKMANKYFPIMEPILAEHGVPDDFKYLAVAESNLRNVSSSAAARGIWQFRKLAAKELDLEVNSEVDERYHIEKATIAACKYIKKLHKRFGTWTNAAAAYNVGPTNFSKMLRAQKQSSFYDLNLNEETSRYVFRLIGIKEIMKDPNKYGFYVEQQDLYGRIDNVYHVEVDKSVPDWGTFAKEHGVTYRTLKYYNPWLRDTKLTVKKNKYLIKLPRR